MLLKSNCFESNFLTFYPQNDSFQEEFEREFEAIPGYQKRCFRRYFQGKRSENG